MSERAPELRFGSFLFPKSDEARDLLAQAEQRFAERRHLYERIAGHQVETSARSVEEAADAILEALGRTR